MNYIQSIFAKKCPKCRNSSLFTKPLKWSDPLSMHKDCKVCGQKFEPEPGYYYGAMFMSYIVTGFLYLGMIAGMIIGLKMTLNQSFLVLLIFVALTYVETARLGRSLWIHFMVKYDGE